RRMSHDPTASGAAELRPALIGSSLSTIVILLPFALLSGVVGAFFKPLALTMALALLVSLGVALVLVPVSVSLLEHPKRAKASAGSTDVPPSRRWERAYGWVVDRFVRQGFISIFTTLLLLGTASALYGRIGTDFLPSMDE